MMIENEDLTLQDIPEGPEIMREEVKNTIKNMKTGKATGPDMISKEMMQALEGIEPRRQNQNAKHNI